MAICKICDREFSNSRSLASHVHKYHQNNTSEIKMRSDESKMIEIRSENVSNMMESGSRTVQTKQVELSFGYHDLLNHPKFLKMICKGILDSSIPMTRELRSKLLFYADEIREIARVRVHKIMPFIGERLIHLIMSVYYESIDMFKKSG